MKKRLSRFYCQPCDNAWIEIIGFEDFHAKCEYCSKLCDAEILD